MEFIKLFIIDESSKESMIKEDTAKMIEATLTATNENERLKALHEPRQFKINRLDSIFLDEMSVKELNRK